MPSQTNHRYSYRSVSKLNEKTAVINSKEALQFTKCLRWKHQNYSNSNLRSNHTDLNQQVWNNHNHVRTSKDKNMKLSKETKLDGMSKAQRSQQKTNGRSRLLSEMNCLQTKIRKKALLLQTQLVNFVTFMKLKIGKKSTLYSTKHAGDQQL